MHLVRVAIIFDNLGPYHWARLEAAGRACHLLAIEVRDNCKEHGWVRQPRSSPFQTITLVRVASGKEPQLRDVSDRLEQVLGEFKPEAVFLPGWQCAAAFVAQHWCSANSVPTVVMSESNSWDEKRVALKEWLKRRLVSNYSAALVGGSTHKDYLVELGLRADRIFLGYDVVDNDYFAEKSEESRKQKAENRGRRSEIGCQRSETGSQRPGVSCPSSVVLRPQGLPENFFLASARFVEKKNLPRLIQAYARYRELAEGAETLKPEALKADNAIPSTLNSQPSTQPWDLVLLGDGPLRASLRCRVSSLKLKDSVLLPGFKQYEELPWYYGNASAFIHASTTEQWGLVVNEAMASGLPVLVSNRCGCAADLVQEGVNGFTFDPDNVEALAQLMLDISAFNFPLSEFGSASQRMISHWSPERFGQGVGAAVEKALEVGSGRISLFDKCLLQLLAALK